MKDSTESILQDLVKRYPRLNSCHDGIDLAVEAIITCYKNDSKVLTCGNGGSAADAQHIVGELMKGFTLPRKINGHEMMQKIGKENGEYICSNLQGSLQAISLVSEVVFLTAHANDIAPDMCFAQQVYGYGREGDILVAISTSGNSRNILYACEVAKAIGVIVIGLTGRSGGKLRDLSHILINVPEDETYKVQELHLPVYHAICLAVENEFFGMED